MSVYYCICKLHFTVANTSNTLLASPSPLKIILLKNILFHTLETREILLFYLKNNIRLSLFPEKCQEPVLALWAPWSFACNKLLLWNSWTPEWLRWDWSLIEHPSHDISVPHRDKRNLRPTRAVSALGWSSQLMIAWLNSASVGFEPHQRTWPFWLSCGIKQYLLTREKLMLIKIFIYIWLLMTYFSFTIK